MLYEQFLSDIMLSQLHIMLCVKKEKKRQIQQENVGWSSLPRKLTGVLRALSSSDMTSLMSISFCIQSSARPCCSLSALSLSVKALISASSLADFSTTGSPDSYRLHHFSIHHGRREGGDIEVWERESSSSSTCRRSWMLLNSSTGCKTKDYAILS